MSAPMIRAATLLSDVDEQRLHLFDLIKKRAVQLGLPEALNPLDFPELPWAELLTAYANRAPGLDTIGEWLRQDGPLVNPLGGYELESVARLAMDNTPSGNPLGSHMHIAPGYHEILTTMDAHIVFNKTKQSTRHAVAALLVLFLAPFGGVPLCRTIELSTQYLNDTLSGIAAPQPRF